MFECSKGIRRHARRFPNERLLKGIAAINMLKDHIQFEYDNVKGAYEKTCEQLIEGYSHIKKGDQRKMLDFMDKVFEEIERTRDAQRSARERVVKKFTK